MKKMHFAGVVLSLAVLFFAGPEAGGAPRPLTPLELEQEVSLAFETPHTAWAKPSAKGTVRALFFAPYRSGDTNLRELVELAQRFDLEADAAYYDTRRSRWLGEEPQAGAAWPREHYEQRWAALEAADYDVYVFLELEPELLPEAMLARVGAAVHRGAGALMIGVEGRALVTGGHRSATLDREAVPPGMYLDYGSGRFALLEAREPVSWRLGWETEYDYLSQLRGRALLWAAGRAPEMPLELGLSGTGAPAALTPLSARLAWRGAPAGTVFDVRLRREDGRVTEQATVEGADDGAAEIALPPLRAGRYYLQAVARGPAGVENWAALTFEAAAAGAVSLELERDWADPETEASPAVSGRVGVSGPGSVRVQLRDRRGRVLARDELPAAGGHFRLPADGRLPMLVWVEAVLVRGEDEYAVSEPQPFRVTRRRRDEFNFVIWGAPRGELGPYAAESMAREGVTAITERGTQPLYLAAHGLGLLPYATQLSRLGHSRENLAECDYLPPYPYDRVRGVLPMMLDREGTLRPTGCYSDQERVARWVDREAADMVESARQGVIAYSLGDETVPRASCLHPACLDTYRGYLEMKYGGDIAALNESWGSDYDSFADIALLEPEEIPAPDAPEWFREWHRQRLEFLGSRYPSGSFPASLPLDEIVRVGDINDEVGALQAGNFARWFDRQAFQAWNLVQLSKRFDEGYRAIDPLARTGFVGTNSFAIPGNPTRIRQGGDLDLMVRELGFLAPRVDPSSDVIRSLAGPGFQHGDWFGFFRDEVRPLARYWGYLADGADMVLWWRWNNVGRYHGLLAEHLAPYPARRAILDDTAVIREGLGTLVRRSQPLDDGVRLLHSFPSTYIVHFDGNGSYGPPGLTYSQSPGDGTYVQSHGAWRALTCEAGLQYRYLTDRQLRLGEFDPDGARVIIMPMALALGDREAAVLREFVAGGGTLIADVRPGTYTGRCRPREAGVLDDVFGIRRTGKAEAAGAAVEVPGLMSWAEGRVDPAVETTTGVARGRAGETPAVIVNEHGAGRAVLLNFPLIGAPAGELVAALLAEAGARAPLRVLGVAAVEDGAAAPAPDEDPDDLDAEVQPLEREDTPQVTRWRNGEIEFLFVGGLGRGDEAQEVRVVLPEARHAYDLRRREALGPTDTLPVSLAPGRYGVFALLPEAAPRAVIYPDRRVNLAGESAAVERGASLEAALAVPGAAGLHALRLNAFGPDGQAVDYFDRVIIAGPEPEPVTLPFAFDDAPGRWRLVFTDLYTGEPVELAVDLR